MATNLRLIKRATVIGIAGCTNAGKTTLTQQLYKNVTFFFKIHLLFYNFS